MCLVAVANLAALREILLNNNALQTVHTNTYTHSAHTDIQYRVETMGNGRNRKLKHREKSGVATPKKKCVSVER